MATARKHPLPGSERAPVTGAREIGPANPKEEVEVTIRLRSRAGKKPAVSAETFNQAPADRQIMTREEYERSHGADPAGIKQVKAFANENGLTVVEESPERRTVILSGTVSAMNKAFDVQLKQFEHPKGGTYRGRTGSVHIPDNLRDQVEAVLGLDNRPQAVPHFRRRRSTPDSHPRGASGSFTPPQVAELYNFPTDADGTGECIGIIELGGGFVQGELTKYFNELKLAKLPQVTAVSIGKGKNNPTGDPNGPDGEVLLDIEVAGSVAPGGSIT